MRRRPYIGALAAAVWATAALPARAQAPAPDAVLEHLIEQHDSVYRSQWDALPEEFKTKMVEGVVAFEISIVRIEGKYKLSQNRPHEDQARVTQSFQETELGDLMARWLDPGV